MRLVFPFIGKTSAGYLDEGINDYVNRLVRHVQVDILILREKVPKSLPEEQFRLKESEQLLESCRDSSFIVALDAGGREVDSSTLAQMLREWEDRGLKTIHFLVGGHLGLHPVILQKADLVLSLSKMTFTHEMTRLIVLEQLYRACMIKSGRKYHN